MNAQEARALTEESLKPVEPDYLRLIYAQIRSDAKKGNFESMVDITAFPANIHQRLIQTLRNDGYRVKVKTVDEWRCGANVFFKILWDNPA